MTTASWLTVQLSDVCSLITDGTHHSPPNLATGDFRYVTAKNIRPWGLDLSDITWVSTEVHQEIYTRCPVEYGDILYIKDGVTTGIAAINTLSEPFSMLSSVALLKPRRDVVNPDFMKHWLNSPSTRTEMTGAMTGSAIRRLVLKQIRVASFPLPPLPEQKRIADKLDRLLARADACRERLDRVPALLKCFRQSVLAAATSGELTREWREEHEIPPATQTTLGQVIKVSSGKFLPAKDMTAGGTIPVFGGNGINGYHDQANVECETLVIGRVGYYCGSIHITPPRAWITDNALIVRFNPEEVILRYLYFALQAIDLRANDSSTAQPVISGAKIYPTPLALPDIREQAEIVRRLDGLFEISKTVEKAHSETTSRVAALTPATLAKAFRGELVPQDPTDEPAAALLARIHAARDAAGASAKKRRLSSTED